MSGLRRALSDLPIPLRCAVGGAALLGTLGAAVGLGIGLRVHAPTAWAATFEVGIPAAVLGAAVGAVVGSVVLLSRRWRPGA
jgi:hypothetical protein